MSLIEYKYFSPKELKCKCKKCDSTGHEMKLELMEPLIVLRRTMDFPFRITSAYRCPTHNNQVGTTGFKGAHTTGCAIDIAIGWAHADKLLECVYGDKFRRSDGIRVFTGIGSNQKGANRFIHLDVLDPTKYNRPATWTY